MLQYYLKYSTENPLFIHTLLNDTNTKHSIHLQPIRLKTIPRNRLPNFLLWNQYGCHFGCRTARIWICRSEQFTHQQGNFKVTISFIKSLMVVPSCILYSFPFEFHRYFSFPRTFHPPPASQKNIDRNGQMYLRYFMRFSYVNNPVH